MRNIRLSTEISILLPERILSLTKMIHCLQQTSVSMTLKRCVQNNCADYSVRTRHASLWDQCRRRLLLRRSRLVAEQWLLRDNTKFVHVFNWRHLDRQAELTWAFVMTVKPTCQMWYCMIKICAVTQKNPMKVQLDVMELLTALVNVTLSVNRFDVMCFSRVCMPVCLCVCACVPPKQF